MAELTVEQRLDRLEKYAQIQCWRCLKTLTLKGAKTIEYPDSGDEIVLCPDCKFDYDELEGKEHNRYEYALKDWLKEIRRKQAT